MLHRTLLCTALPALAAALMATACTSSPPPSATEARQVAPAAAQPAQERETMTGSRIPRKSTDRMVNSIDAAGAREMERSRPPNPGPRIQ